MIIAITDRHILLEGVTLEDHIAELLSSSADYVLLRESDWNQDEFNQCLTTLYPLTKRYWHKLILPLHSDLGLKWGIENIHLKSNQRLQSQRAILGMNQALPFCYSCSLHSLEDIKATNLLPWRFRFISPVAPTSCKPGVEPLCTDDLKAALALSSSPLVALGGINLTKAKELYALGFKHIALRSFLMTTKEPNAVIEQYKNFGF